MKRLCEEGRTGPYQKLSQVKKTEGGIAWKLVI